MRITLNKRGSFALQALIGCFATGFASFVSLKLLKGQYNFNELQKEQISAKNSVIELAEFFRSKTAATLRSSSALANRNLCQSVTESDGRSYKVKILDLKNMTERCSNTPEDSLIRNAVLASNSTVEERFVVDVQVLWQDRLRNQNRELASVVIAEGTTLPPTPPVLPPGQVATNIVGVVFEDSVANGYDSGWNYWDWDYRDIRACIRGDFRVDPVTHRIYSTSTTPQSLNIISQSRNVACRHRFFIEVYDSTGNKKYESQGYDTSSNANNYSHTSNITVSSGDEIVLSWAWVSNSACRFNGRDPSSRLNSSRTQSPTGANQTLPPPSFYYGWCGDFTAGQTPFQCQGTHPLNGTGIIRDDFNTNDDLPVMTNSDYISGDSVTIAKYCEVTGHPRVYSSSTSTITPSGRSLLTWNPTTLSWVKSPASTTNNRVLSAVDCRCP